MTDSYLNWFDKNKFKTILAILDSNKFGCRDKIGEFKYINFKDLVNNIKNNTVSEISAKKSLNTLNEIKNAEIVNITDPILTDKTLESESQEDKNEKEN